MVFKTHSLLKCTPIITHYVGAQNTTSIHSKEGIRNWPTSKLSLYLLISSLGLIYLNEKRLNIQELCIERREYTKVEREQYAQFDSSIL